MVMLTKHKYENHGIDRNDNDGEVMIVLDCDEKRKKTTKKAMISKIKMVTLLMIITTKSYKESP